MTDSPATSRLVPRQSELPALLSSPAGFVRRYAIPLLILAAGATFDAVTTYANVAAYGHEIEVHPVQQVLFAYLGPAVGVPVAKLAQLGFVVFVAAWWKPWCPWMLAACGSLYGLAALSNHFLWL